MKTEDRYRELLEMAQSYLLQNFSRTQKIFVDDASFSFFTRHVPKKAAPAAPPPALPMPPLPPAPILKKDPEPKKIEIVKEEKPAPPAKDKKLELQPPELKDDDDFKDLRSLVARLAPNIRLYEKPLENLKPSPAVILLSFNESPEELQLLRSVARATSDKLAPAKIINACKIEERNSWSEILEQPGLKAVIASSQGVEKSPLLKMLYASKKERFILIDEISCLISDSKRKAALWNALKEKVR